MSKVLLNTDSVATVSSGMGTLSSNVDTIISSINSYDVSGSEFPFADAKAAIVSNVEKTKTKISNTKILLDKVISVHSNLQESVGTTPDLDTGTSKSDDDGKTYSSPDNSKSSSGGHHSSSKSSEADPTQMYGGYGAYMVTDGAIGSQAISGAVSGISAVSEVSTATATSGAGATKDTTELLASEKFAEMATIAVSDDDYKELYEKYKITEISATSLATTVAKGMHLVVEGISTDIKMLDYLDVVGSAAMSYNASVEFVKLDQYDSAVNDNLVGSTVHNSAFSVTNSSNAVHDNLVNVSGVTNIDAYTAVEKDDANNSFSFKSVLGTDEEKAKVKDTASEVTEMLDSKASEEIKDGYKLNETGVHEDSYQKIDNTGSSTGKLDTFSASVITDSFTSVASDSSEIAKLNNFKCASGVTMSFSTLPVTMIVKNNVVVFFKSGYLTETELKSALASAERIPLVN